MDDLESQFKFQEQFYNEIRSPQSKDISIFHSSIQNEVEKENHEPQYYESQIKERDDKIELLMLQLTEYEITIQESQLVISKLREEVNTLRKDKIISDMLKRNV